MARLFVAVWPPELLVEELCGLPRKPRPGIKWILPENWHVTLRFLPDADAAEVADRLDHALLPESVARYGPGVDVLWERVVVLPVAGLDALAGAVTDSTFDLGSEPPRKRFVGHLTLARVQRGGRVPSVVGMPFAATQQPVEVALVESTLRPTGPIYETVATWPTR